MKDVEDFPAGEDDEVTEGQRWSRMDYTMRMEKQAKEAARTRLKALLAAASTSNDPKVTYAWGEYSMSKVICEIFAGARGTQGSGLP